MKQKLEHVKTIDIMISKTNQRKDFNPDSMLELKESIEVKGILQPIIVRKKDDKYELIAGERRYRAALSLKLETVPCAIIEATDEEAKEIQVVENLQRKDVHPMEEAVAFKKILSNSPMLLAEFGKRFGKSGSYVAQRLQLTTLIDNFQNAFLGNRMTLWLALEVSKLDKKIQKEIWDEDDFDNEDEITISSHTLKNYSQDLLNAPFDTDDKTLNPKSGSCEGCQHNTASNTLLFPEAATSSKCLLLECFKKKAEVYFEKELKSSIADPAIILIDNGYKKSEITKKLEKDGNTVLLKGYSNERPFDAHEEQPELTYKEWLDEENEDDSKDNKKQYESWVKGVKQENEKAKKDIEDGKLNTAFVVNGEGRGRYIYIKLRKPAKKGLETGVAGDSKPNIAAEIKRMQDNEVRKKEIDEEKTTVAFYEAIGKNKNYVSDKPLSKNEQVAQVVFMFKSLGYEEQNMFKKQCGYKESYGTNELYTKLVKETPATLQKNINRLTRLYVLDKCCPGKGTRPEKSDTASVLHDIVLESCPVAAKNILKDMASEREKRGERLKERINLLKKK